MVWMKYQTVLIFKLKKSVLENYDQGKITREQAIDSVSVTYY